LAAPERESIWTLPPSTPACLLKHLQERRDGRSRTVRKAGFGLYQDNRSTLYDPGSCGRG
jgi:hypothetical protein